MVDLDEALMLIDEAEARGGRHLEGLRELIEGLRRLPVGIMETLVSLFGEDGSLSPCHGWALAGYGIEPIVPPSPRGYNRAGWSLSLDLGPAPEPEPALT